MISLNTQNSDKKVTTSGALVKTKCSKGLTTEQKPLKNPIKEKKHPIVLVIHYNLKSVTAHVTLIILIINNNYYLFVMQCLNNDNV